MPLPSIRAGPTRSALIGDQGEPRPDGFQHEIRAPSRTRLSRGAECRIS